MAWAHVQSRSADKGEINGTTTTLAFLANVTAGSVIVVGFTRGSPTDIVTGVTDSLGNTYTRVPNGWQVDAGHSQGLWMYYAPNSAAGACTVTVTFTSGFLSYNAIVILEYSGGATAPMDVGAGQFDSTGSTGSNADVSTAAVTTVAGDLIVGLVMATSTGATTWTPGTGFQERQEVTAQGAAGMQAEDLVQSSAGSIQATWTASDTSQYVAIMAAFKPAAGAAGTSILFRTTRAMRPHLVR